MAGAPGERRRDRGVGDRSGPRKMAASLSEAARRLGVEGAVELASLRQAWVTLVGAQVASHCWPTSLRNGCLTISADHSAWASELRLLQSELLVRARPVAPSVDRVSVHVSPRGGGDW